MKQLLSKQFVCHNSSESVALTTNGDDSPTVSDGNGNTVVCHIGVRENVESRWRAKNNRIQLPYRANLIARANWIMMLENLLGRELSKFNFVKLCKPLNTTLFEWLSMKLIVINFNRLYWGCWNVSFDYLGRDSTNKSLTPTLNFNGETQVEMVFFEVEN